MLGEARAGRKGMHLRIQRFALAHRDDCGAAQHQRCFSLFRWQLCQRPSSHAMEKFHTGVRRWAGDGQILYLPRQQRLAVTRQVDQCGAVFAHRHLDVIPTYRWSTHCCGAGQASQPEAGRQTVQARNRPKG